jgi:anhydro-N-acetylmuramic acid kinase
MWDLKQQSCIYIGCMTGTSADGQADFTAVRFEPDGRVKYSKNTSVIIPSELQVQLLYVSKAAADKINIQQRAAIEMALTVFLADAYKRVIDQLGLADYPRKNLVLSPHGQTINHQPFAALPYTDILVNGEWLSAKTGCRVVTRHRQAALVVSSAAPLAPVLIRQLFYDPAYNTIVINGGGIANITILVAESRERVIGYDTGPANAPIDALIQYILDLDRGVVPADLLANIMRYQCDYNGCWASRGRIIQVLYNDLLSHEYFSRSQLEKSADRNSFDLEWILPLINDKDYYWRDVLATLSCVVADSIIDAVSSHMDATLSARPMRCMIYGGLRHNTFIVNRMTEQLQKNNRCTIEDMNEFGYDPDYFEALLMAYLGFCADHHIPIDLSYCAREGIEADKAYAHAGTVTYPNEFYPSEADRG